MVNIRSSHHTPSVGRTSTSTSSTRDLANTVVTAAESSRKINTQAANIAQLRLSNIKLHGRDDDIKLLRSKLREVAKKKGNDEDDVNNKGEHDDEPDPNKQSTNNNLMLVSGISGTGKSSLIRKGLGEPAAKNGYTFASGKFDEKMLRPLSAFSNAMTSLAKHIIVESNQKGGLSMATLIRDKIRDEFDEEDMEQLRRVLPGCTELLGVGAQRSSLYSTSSEADAADALGSLDLLAGKESIAQMHYAIRRLLKIVCSCLKGAVLFIDDLQWSDTTTLDLLKSIVLDGEIPNLLIIGAYREDEVPDHHPLVLHIRDLEQMNVSITQIKIGNLGVDNLIPLVAEALGMDDDDDKVKSLAETIHKKTDGNPFFVLIFLRSLHDEKLLQYNFGALKWTWDDEAVNSKIVTENVVSVLVNKMNRLQETTQMMLMVASYLGATFRLSAVLKVMNNLSQAEMGASMQVSKRSNPVAAAKMESSSNSLLTSVMSASSTNQDGSDSSYASSIEELQEEGLCEVDNEECHFVHDQIQSAANELISPDERDSFRGRIGSVLLQHLSPEELDSSLFEVVGLLNCAASNIIDEERDELARMNLRAGIKASENAAFDAAKVYFKAGREALGSKGWKGDRSIMLDLCSHGANACYVIGEFDTMNELIEEVLSKDINTEEKFRVTDIKVRSFLSAEKWNESIDVALDFLCQLGLPTLQKKPASKFAIIREYIRVKRLLKHKTAEDIANLTRVNDGKYEMGQRMYSHLEVSIYNVEPTMFPLIIFQMVTTSLKHGLNSSSSAGFAGLGMLLCGPFGKPREGLEMVKAAELILKKPGMRRSTVHTIFLTQGFCYHWTSPLHDTIEPLLTGYQIGLETGENEKAGYCLITRSYHLYYIGRPLDSIQKELEASIPVLTQLNQENCKSYITCILTTLKKLLGIDAGASDKVMESIFASATSTGDTTLSAYVNVMKLEVFVFFQEWREAIDLVRKAGNVRLILSCLYISVRYTFLEALTYLKVAQSASGWKKKQMKKSAHKTIQIIRGWAKKGNVNVVHYLYILEAELAVLNGRNNKATDKFNAAIATSSRNGFLQDRALAHELTSSYFNAQGDDNWGNYHIERSRACYEEWGCSEKVKQLRSM